jgi:thiol-disulfide isomerase/thioredoxin
MNRNFLSIAIIAVLSAGLGLYFGAKGTPSAPSSMAAATVPAAAPASPVENLYSLSLPDLNGQPQALAQWRGKPLVINFWATWCPPCVKEIPELVSLHAQLAQNDAPKDIQLIGIGVDTAPHIAQFAADHQITYPLYVAGVDGTELSRQLGNETGGLPFTVLIGRDGKIKKSYLGLIDFKRLRADLAAL